MTTGTKVFLALFAVIVGVLVVYYGIVVPDRSPAEGQVSVATPEQQRSGAEPAPPPQTQTATVADPDGVTANAPPRSPAPTAIVPSPAAVPDASSAGGLLSEGVREATGYPEGASSLPRPSPNAQTQAILANPLLPLVGLNGGDYPPTEPVIVQPSTNSAASTDVQSTPAQPRPIDHPVASKSQPPPRAEYRIVGGDTFTSIAAAWLGDESKWSLIARENPTIDPQRLRVGQIIYLPSKDSVVAPPATLAKVSDGETIYVIESGDSLIAIARAHLDDAGRWEQIYALNRDVIGSDPAALKVGMRIRMPKK